MDNNLARVSIEFDEEKVKVAIHSVSARDWNGFFEVLRQNTYKQLRGGNGDDLAKIVKALDSVEAMFHQVKNRIDKPQ